jgi:hypothetical protein
MTAWQMVFGFGLILHGIGHVLGIMPVFMSVTDGWTTRSWALSGAIGDGAATAIAIGLWSICLIGFVAAGLGVLGIAVPQSWWRPLAVAAAVVSLATVILFWNGLPFLVPNKVGAIGVDLVLLIGILFLSWPSDEMLGT